MYQNPTSTLKILETVFASFSHADSPVNQSWEEEVNNKLCDGNISKHAGSQVDDRDAWEGRDVW
jgi:hypothetical protein